jgi:hypothetical protein
MFGLRPARFYTTEDDVARERYDFGHALGIDRSGGAANIKWFA